MATHTYTHPTNPDHSPELVRRREVGRRALALGGAFSAIGITAGVAASLADIQAAPLTSADAELITACEQHERLKASIDGHDLSDDDPLWEDDNRNAEIICAAKPMTFAGLVAKAAATKLHATLPDGTVELEVLSADWALDLVNDLVRLGGRV